MTEAALARPVNPPARATDYLALMKPRVMSLVVFTALTGMVAAPVDPNPFIALTALLAIAAGAGAAGALNMAYDADIDAVMARTCARPIPAGRISREEAAAFGLVVAALSVIALALAGGPFAAALLAFTIFFYAVVYTMWLKRSTPQNIVIGGLAGALPPAIAWAAATGELGLAPLLLVLIIFVWTPPHFWALALYRAGDYARAGVPMLPVVAGAASARGHILAYALILAPLGLAPAAIGLGGAAYLVVAAAAGCLFVVLAWRLARSRAGEQAEAADEAGQAAIRLGEAAARRLFAFSILYLALLFAALFAEHGLGLMIALPWRVGGGS